MSLSNKELLQAIETRYMNEMCNRLIDRWGLGLHQARDISRDLFYTYVFPVYELGGQYGFKAGFTRSEVESCIKDSLEAAAKNAYTTTYESKSSSTYGELITVVKRESITDKRNIKIK